MQDVVNQNTDAILHQHGPPTHSEDISTLPGSGKEKRVNQSFGQENTSEQEFHE